ncbi:MAG: methionine synthase [Candidatus Omnitrophota bacterium]
MKEFNGFATGIGSLPHKDADQALDIVFQYCPAIPFWPQLPRRSSREGMVAQFSEKLPCLEFTSEGIIFNSRDRDRELEFFYDRVIAGDADYFKISPDFAAGLYGFCRRLEGLSPEALRSIVALKCHITGPFTFAASLNNDENISLIHDEVFMQVILKGLAMKALWQLRLFKKFGKEQIIFIDEPYLAGFGSAFTPVNKQTVESILAELTSAIKAEGALVGVHCCGNTDWPIFLDSPAIDIINFDAFSFFERLALYADNLKAFFKRGGSLCWGIVPTTEFKGSETPESLAALVNSGINTLAKKGIDRDLLAKNLLISPSCGLGTLDPAKAEQIFQVLSKTSAFLRR